MGLFDFLTKKKPQQQTVKLISTKKEQAVLENLEKFHDPLKVWLDLSDNGNLLIRVGKNMSRTAGKLPPNIVKQFEEKYGNDNGLNYNITVGENYIISKEEDSLVCTVTLTIEK